MKKTSKIISIILTVVMLMGLMTSVSFAADVSYVVSDALPTTFGWSAAVPGEIMVYVPLAGENATYYLDLYKDDELIKGNYEATFTASGKQTSDVFKTKIEELGTGEYKYKIGLERDEDCGEVRKNTGFSLEYRRLGTHVAQEHDLTIKAYKERFGLCNSAKTTEANYSRMMRDYAYQHNMPEQLRIAGANTRIKPGETHLRLGKPTRLQENLAKRARRAS